MSNSPEEVSFVTSHRQTTSSRRPGVLIRGTVHVVKVPLARCCDCGGRWTGGAYHAPHWRGGVLVDCVGREIPKSST